MAKKLSKSNEHLSSEEIANIFSYREKSLNLLFSNRNPNFPNDFAGFTMEEINNELKEQLNEVEKDACLNLLASIEAKFRLDYAIRCEARYKDNVSRKFREAFAEKQYRISLEDVILGEWGGLPDITSSIISNVKEAFKYLHWLAHGRYWTYKSQKFDFFGLYNLALQVNGLPLKS